MAVTILTGQGDIAIFLFISVQYLTFKGSNNISSQQRSLNTRFATRDEKYYPLVRGLGKKKDGDLLQINRFEGVLRRSTSLSEPKMGMFPVL